MVIAKNKLSVLSIFAVLLFIQCHKATSARIPAPSPTPTNENSSPAPTPTPVPTSEPASDSPLSISELFELSLPEIGVQKTVIPQSEGAKVANKQLEGVERKIDEFKGILMKRQAEATKESSKKCLAQCQQNLEDAINGVKTSIESINVLDIEKAKVDISGVATDIEACNDCFIQVGDEHEYISSFSGWVRGVTSECLVHIKDA